MITIAELENKYKTSKWSIRAFEKEILKHNNIKTKLEKCDEVLNYFNDNHISNKNLKLFIGKVSLKRKIIAQKIIDIETKKTNEIIPILDFDKFLAIMISLKTEKVINCSYKEFARMIYYNFFTGKKKSTIEEMLKPSKEFAKYKVVIEKY